MSKTGKRDIKNGKSIDKKKIASIVVLVIGAITLIVGVVFLVMYMTRGAAVADGEYLVAADEWVLSDCSGDDCERVVWDFDEDGKGSLTTDGGEHHYDFRWAIKDGKLLMQTDWLYEMDNEYEYSLDQGSGTLHLKDDSDEYTFTAE